MYLFKTLNAHQGGHELLNLSTNKIITQQNYTEIPLTQLAKDRVHAIAEKENMESTLTILNWHGKHISDYDPQIAGVPVEDNQMEMIMITNMKRKMILNITAMNMKVTMNITVIIRKQMNTKMTFQSFWKQLIKLQEWQATITMILKQIFF